MREVDPKKYLKQIEHIDADIKSRQEEVNRLRSSLMIKTSTLKQSVVQETRQGMFDERYMNLLDKVDDLSDKIEELVILKVKVSNEIDKINDRASRIILRERYLNLKTFEEIAKTIDYDPRYTHTLHGKALIHFKEIMLEHGMTV